MAGLESAPSAAAFRRPRLSSVSAAPRAHTGDLPRRCRRCHYAAAVTGRIPVPDHSEVVYRVLRAELESVRERNGVDLVRVLDVGGGTGAWAVPLALAGCLVTVVDSSPNALAVLHRRAGDAGVASRVRALQGDVDALSDAVEPGAADLVLGHGLLEVVEDDAAAIRALATAVAPGGAVSVLVAGRFAAVLSRALAGRLGEARQLLADPDGRWGADDPLWHRVDVDGLRRLLELDAGLTVERIQGDGVLVDLVPNAVLETNPTAVHELAALEMAAADRPPLRDVASRLHALARRPGEG